MSPAPPSPFRVEGRTAMPILIALIGAAITAFIWYTRAQRGADAARQVIGAAQDLKNAPRRIGFRRRANQHAVEGIEDPEVAIGALAVAFVELDDLPTAETRKAMDISLRKHLNLDAETAQEIAVLGHWLVEECHGASPAFDRIAKKLRKLDGNAAFQRLMAVLGDIAGFDGGSPSARQSDALADLARIFRLQ